MSALLRLSDDAFGSLQKEGLHDLSISPETDSKPYLPAELWHEIIDLLPTKDLPRIGCVSMLFFNLSWKFGYNRAKSGDELDLVRLLHSLVDFACGRGVALGVKADNFFRTKSLNEIQVYLVSPVSTSMHYHQSISRSYV